LKELKFEKRRLNFGNCEEKERRIQTHSSFFKSKLCFLKKKKNHHQKLENFERNSKKFTITNFKY